LPGRIVSNITIGRQNTNTLAFFYHLCYGVKKK